METPIQNYVEQKIFSIRGIQVMLDSDLAQLFEVETKVFNQAVKRNSNRFPSNFRFQLTKEEYNLLRSQFVTLKQAQGQHRKYLPFAFTEQGVAMLTGIIKSDIAVDMSIKIMNAFVELRKLINSSLFFQYRIDAIEVLQLTYEKENELKFDQIFNALSNKDYNDKEKIFYDGQIYDAYSFFIDIIKKANSEIILIDNYMDISVLDMLSKKKQNVNIKIITHSKSNINETDIKKFNQQYPPLKISYSNKIHDRFIIIDQTELYHIGASLKDLGKKWFAFSRMDSLAADLLKKLES